MKQIKLIVLIITGLFFITNCSKDDELDQTTNDYPSLGTIKFYNNVINLDNESNTSLTQITYTTLTFNGTTQISSVKVNDFLIGAPTTLCPTGYLRKVLSITKNGETYTFNTQFATLDEVIEECNISEIVTNNVFYRNTQTTSVSTSFDVVLFDGDANTSTENDQAKITGSLDLTPKLIFEMKKRKGANLKSGYIKAGVEFEIEKDFDFTCKTSLVNFEKEETIGNELRGPTFLLGGAIFVTPTLKFSLGMKGGVSSNMKIGTHETSTYKIFKELNNGTFTDVQFEKSYTPSSLNLDFTGNASAEVYLKAKYSLKVYEVIGLNVSSKVYLKGDANVSATNLTQVNYCTKWGLKGAAGIDINVFGSDILSAEIENQLYEAPLPSILGVNPCGVIILNSIPTNGLVAYYPFNGNSNDESGNNNNGTVYGPTLTTDRMGNVNKAYYFDGIDDYIKVLNSNSLMQLDNNYTYSLWIKREDNFDSNYGGVLYKSDVNSTHFSFYTGYNFSCEYYHNAILKNDNGSNSAQLSSWQHFVVKIENGIMTSYLNGVQNSNTFSGGGNPKSVLNDLFIGYVRRYSSNRYFFGKIDDLRIYNRPLSNSEIQSLYNE